MTEEAESMQSAVLESKLEAGFAAAAPLKRAEGRAERFEAEALPHMRSLYGTARRLTGNASDAEDLVQETFLRAYRAYDSFASGTNIRAWLFTILYRTRTDGFRRAGRSPRTVELLEDRRSVPPPQDALAQGGELVARALERVPEHHRTALVLRDVEDLSYSEIARVIDAPIGTVMSRIHRGRSMLRVALGGAPLRRAQRAD